MYHWTDRTLNDLHQLQVELDLNISAEFFQKIRFRQNDIETLFFFFWKLATK